MEEQLSVDIGCNLSEVLLEYLWRGHVKVDWIKLSREEFLCEELILVQAVRGKLELCTKVLVHTLSDIGEESVFPDIGPDKDKLLEIFTQEPETPHVASHLAISKATVKKWRYDDPHVTPGDLSKTVLDFVVAKVSDAINGLNRPLLLENVPYYGKGGVEGILAAPRFFEELREELRRRDSSVGKDVGLLLDLGHAKTSARCLHNRKISIDEIFEYIRERYPLSEVKEIHVSGADRDEDCPEKHLHKEMEDEDFELLANVL